MSRLNALTFACACACWLAVQVAPQHARAQKIDPRPKQTEARVGSPRLSLGAGVGMTTSVSPEIDDQPTGDQPSSFLGKGQMPIGVLRLDMPVHRLVLLGAQVAVMKWGTQFEEDLGFDLHTTLDLSALPRFRLGLGSHKRHELVVSLPLGVSFDISDTGPRNYGESIDHGLGLHAGVTFGYQYMPVYSPFGFFIEGGFVYHYLPQTIEYSIPGSARSDDQIYQPVQLLFRGGVMLLFLR